VPDNGWKNVRPRSQMRSTFKGFSSHSPRSLKPVHGRVGGRVGGKAGRRVYFGERLAG
jgi:hypothetical protein